MPYSELIADSDIPYFEELYYRTKDALGSHGKAQNAVRMCSNQITDMRRGKLPSVCARRISAAYSKHVPNGKDVDSALLYLQVAQKRTLIALREHGGWANCTDLDEENAVLEALVDKGLAEMRRVESKRRRYVETNEFKAI